MCNLSGGDLRAVIRAVDQLNADDPNQLSDRPLALAEGEIASGWVERLAPDAGDEVRIAARAHHLRRWVTPRATYPDGRDGYLRWRRDQKIRHAGELSALLTEAGFDETAISRVGAIVKKQGLASDPEVQLYEDAVALTFLETQFAATVDRLDDDDHMVEIIAKTLAKMTPAGRTAALTIELDDRLAELVARAQQV